MRHGFVGVQRRSFSFLSLWEMYNRLRSTIDRNHLFSGYSQYQKPAAVTVCSGCLSSQGVRCVFRPASDCWVPAAFSSRSVCPCLLPLSHPLPISILLSILQIRISSQRNRPSSSRRKQDVRLSPQRPPSWSSLSCGYEGTWVWPFPFMKTPQTYKK